MLRLPREPIAALNRVKLCESGEPLVDISSILPILREHAVPFARRGVAERLETALKNLPSGLGLGLREAWRSIERQKFVFDRYFQHLRESHPALPYSTLRRLTMRFYAPYDQKAPPGHSTGGAIDVWLLDAKGEPIDLHGEGDRFANAPTFKPGLPKDIAEGRAILFGAMTSAGFTNCREEWWHYSYGDAAWAVRTGANECIYGYAPVDEKLYREKDEAYINEILSGEN